MTVIFRIICEYEPLIRILHRFIPHMNQKCMDRKYLERFEPIEKGFLHIIKDPRDYERFLQEFEIGLRQARPNIPADSIPIAQLFDKFVFPESGFQIIFECGNDESNPRDWFPRMTEVFEKVPKLEIIREETPDRLIIAFTNITSFQVWGYLMNRRYL